MKSFRPISLLLICFLTTDAHAAEAAPDPVDEAFAAGPLTTTVTLGYDSRYVLYGYRLSRHLWHADVFFTYPLTSRWLLTGGSWYGYLTDGTYHEVDVYVGADYVLTDVFTVGVQYSLFNYLEVPFPTSDQVHELAAHVSYARGPVYLSVRDQYDSEADGHLLRVLGSWYQGLTDRVSLSLNAEFGYAFRYFIAGDLPNHALFTARLPIQCTDSVSLIPFIAQSEPLAAINDFEVSETYGGASVGIAF